jgi:hypothetical protein
MNTVARPPLFRRRDFARSCRRHVRSPAWHGHLAREACTHAGAAQPHEARRGQRLGGATEAQDAVHEDRRAMSLRRAFARCARPPRRGGREVPAARGRPPPRDPRALRARVAIQEWNVPFAIPPPDRAFSVALPAPELDVARYLRPQAARVPLMRGCPAACPHLSSRGSEGGGCAGARENLGRWCGRWCLSSPPWRGPSRVGANRTTAGTAGRPARADRLSRNPIASEPILPAVQGAPDAHRHC